MALTRISQRLLFAVVGAVAILRAIRGLAVRATTGATYAWVGGVHDVRPFVGALPGVLWLAVIDATAAPRSARAGMIAR
ncbi:MAG: hypothetical protein AB7S26_00100 [Sandaracinaceae bacterium]